MIVVLNHLGYINLNKALIQFDKFYEYYRGSAADEIVSDFLSDNKVYLNDDMQITDGKHVFGLIKFKH